MDISPNQFNIIPLKEKIVLPEDPTERIFSGIGGWGSESDALAQGKVRLEATNERLLFGDVTDALVGIGIYIGKYISSGVDKYILRAGDPSNNYFYFDGTNVTITGVITTGAGSVIDGKYLTNASVTGTAIANATITATNITNATITGTQIASATITATNIANAAITTTQISATAGITGTQLANNTITASQITNATITTTQISGTAGITGGQIANNTISATQITNATITATQIATGAVTPVKTTIPIFVLSAGTFTNNSPIAGKVAWASCKVSYNGTESTISDSNTSSVYIVWDSVTPTAFSGSATVPTSSTVFLVGINSGGTYSSVWDMPQVNGSQIQANTITATQIANATITGTQIASATIAAANIANATITATQIADAAITTTQIANATIIATNISGTAGITGGQLSATAGITGTQIANTTITGGNIVNNTVTIGKCSIPTHFITATWTDDTPDTNSVAWASAKVDYNGSTYSITAGNTNKKYVWWDYSLSTTTFQTTDTLPTLADGDCLVAYNNAGVHRLLWNATDVDGSQIQTAAITGSLIANTTITGGNIANNTITATQIANATITGTQIASTTIAGSNIINNTITAGKVSLPTHFISGTFTNNSPIAGKVAWSGVTLDYNGTTYTITAGNTDSKYIWWDYSLSTTTFQTSATLPTLVNGDCLIGLNNSGIYQSIWNASGVNGGIIENATITGGSIANTTITGSNLVNNTITATQIANATITATQLANATITATQIANATITATQIANATITATQIANNTITASQIANATITADQITNLTITGAKIANLTITDTQIGDMSVGKLTAGSITSKAITLAIAAGTGDSKIQAGKTDFTNLENGFILGIDDDDGDKAKFYIGDATNNLNWDGTNLIINGSTWSLTGSGNVSGFTRITTSTASVNTHSTDTEQTLLSVSIPANLLEIANGVKFKIVVDDIDISNAARTITLRLKYGATTIATIVINNPDAAMSNCYGVFEGYIIGSGATNTQFGYISYAVGDGVVGAATALTNTVGFKLSHGTAAEDSTGALNLVVTAQNSFSSTTDGLLTRSYIVERVS